jgi:hypothetical protein
MGARVRKQEGYKGRTSRASIASMPPWFIRSTGAIRPEDVAEPTNRKQRRAARKALAESSGMSAQVGEK